MINPNEWGDSQNAEYFKQRKLKDVALQMEKLYPEYQLLYQDEEFDKQIQQYNYFRSSND